MKKSMLFFIFLPVFLLPAAFQDWTAARADEGRPAADATAPLVLVEVRQLQMGVMSTLSVYAPDVETGRKACARAFDRVRELNAVLSDYDPDSELGRLVARSGQGPVPVGPDLFRALSDAREMAGRTGGRLDPTVGALIRLWRKARLEKKLPAPEALAEARRTLGYWNMVLDPAARTVELRVPGLRLDLGAFAKGWAGDEALSVLRSNGLAHAMFEAGGDMVFGEPPPGRAGWPVELPDTRLPAMEPARCALSVSGDTVQFVEFDGRRYSHVVDPDTGYGLTNRIMCVVKAGRGALSDPLATAGTLMREAAYRDMLKRHYPGVEAWIFPAPEDGR